MSNVNHLTKRGPGQIVGWLSFQMSLWSSNTGLLFTKCAFILPIWASADSFNIWSWSVWYWYSLSKSKDPSASISPQSCQFLPLYASLGRGGPGLILEGLVWFVVLICMSVCAKMGDSCQCRGICLCHLLPSSSPRLPSPPLLLFSSLSVLFQFSVTEHSAKASTIFFKWITPLSQPLKRRFNQE